MTWRPPQSHLNYPTLYRGVPEYLRTTPDPNRMHSAQMYMNILIQELGNCSSVDAYLLQVHRIAWTREWLIALPNDDAECSDAETVDTGEFY